jgi:hypothetical protein
MTSDELFTTKEVHVFCTLYGRSHELVPNGVVKDRDRMVWFSFATKDVTDDVQAIREGKELKVDLHRYFFAYMMFRCIMHGEQQDMLSIIALDAMGNKVVDDGIWRERGMVMYEFEPGFKDDLGKFWSLEKIEVGHSTIQKSMGWFRSNIHNVQ